MEKKIIKVNAKIEIDKNESKCSPTCDFIRDLDIHTGEDICILFDEWIISRKRCNKCLSSEEI